MSNDAPEGGAQPERGTRRPPRLGDSGAPIGSTLSIVLALVAVVAGFLILRAISDDDGDGGTLAPTPDDTSEAAQTTTTAVGAGQPSVAPTTAESGPAQRGARVIVANANNTGGSAGRMSRALETAGWTVVEPVDAVAPENELEESKVYFVASNARAQAVATSVAEALGGVAVAPLPAEIPVDGGDIGRAAVLVMLGNDAADQTLEDLAAANAGGTNPPVAPGGGTQTTASG